MNNVERLRTTTKLDKVQRLFLNYAMYIKNQKA